MRKKHESQGKRRVKMLEKEYVRTTPAETVTKCTEAHMKAVEKWPYGRMTDYWTDQEGNLCIRYMTGKWFHYIIDSTGAVHWWQEDKK